MVSNNERGFMNIDYSESNTHVEDSYQYTDYNLNVMTIIRERHLQSLPVTRTFDSYVREWRGHNRLYNLGLFRSHTKDVDLNEQNTFLEEVIWFILGGL